MITEGRKFEIYLNRIVTQIQINDDRKSVTVSAVNNKNERYTYTADHVIVTVSLGILKSNTISFEPPLPNEMCDAIKNIGQYEFFASVLIFCVRLQIVPFTGFGSKIKVLLVFERTFWPNIEVLGTEEENPPGYPLFFINLHKIHGLPALLGTVGAGAVSVADADNEKEILDRSKPFFIFGIKPFDKTKISTGIHGG